jgi:hypothetical protein
VPVWAIPAFQAEDQVTWAMPRERCSLLRQASSPHEQYPGAGVEVWDWRLRLLGNRSRDAGEGLALQKLPEVAQRLGRLVVGGNALVERGRVIEGLYCRSLLAGPSLG